MHATAAGDCGVNYTYAGFWCPKCAGLLKLRIEYKLIGIEVRVVIITDQN